MSDKFLKFKMLCDFFLPVRSLQKTTAAPLLLSSAALLLLTLPLSPHLSAAVQPGEVALYRSEINIETIALLWHAAEESTLRQYEAVLNQALWKNPRDAMVSFALTLYHLRLFELNAHSPLHFRYLKKALQLAEQTQALAPQKNLGTLARAYVAYFMTDADEAEAILNTLASSSTHLPQVSVFLRCALLAQNPAASELAVRQLFSEVLYPEDFHGSQLLPPKALIALVQPLLLSHPHLKKMLTAPALPTAYRSSALFLLGSIYETHKGDISNARKAYLQAHSLGLRGADLFQALARTHLPQHPRQALIWLQQGESFLPAARSFSPSTSVPSASPHASHHWQKGWALFSMGQNIAAQEEFLKAMHHYAAWDLYSSEQKLNLLKTLYHSSNQKQAFVALVKKITTQIPSITYSHRFLGELYSELGHHETALKAWHNALALDENNPQLHSQIALSFYRIRHFSQALQHLHIATAAQPNATNFYNVACLKARLGEKKEALEYLQKALQLNPQLQQQARLDQDLATLRSHEAFRKLTTQNTSTHQQPSVKHEGRFSEKTTETSATPGS